MIEGSKTSVPSGGWAWPLYGAAFFTALSLSICWTAMPFVLIALGGTPAHVGYAPAANSLAYMAALLVTGSLLGHLEVKRITRIAIIIAFLAAGIMFTAVWAAARHDTAVWSSLAIGLIIFAGALGGAAMALYWPFLMSWVSARFEGVELNRRFGRYNGSWSGGSVVGPLIGARLVECHILWPMGVSVVCFVLTFLLLCVARNGAQRGAVTSEPESAPPSDSRLLGDYRWMSRVVMFCAWAAYSVARSQFALLFTDELGFSKSQFGVYLTTFALCNFLALIAAGRWAFWHFKPVFLFGAQLMLLVAMLMIVYGRLLGVFYLSAVILGLAFGFAYSSHLYYGASASRDRSVRMAIHELVISLGIALGSGLGGYLGKNVGGYSPYWFAIVLIGVGVVVQLAIHGASSVLAARQDQTVQP